MKWVAEITFFEKRGGRVKRVYDQMTIDASSEDAARDYIVAEAAGSQFQITSLQPVYSDATEAFANFVSQVETKRSSN